jgi:DnaJ-class molecular chaperone
MQADLYTTLGVTRTDGKEAIQRAYKKLAMQHHPDRADGDHDAFTAINAAYEILSDDKRRAQYDLTGDTRPEIHLEDVRKQQLATLMLQIVSQQDIDTRTHDIVQVMRDFMSSQMTGLTTQIESHKNGILKLQESVKRLTNKKNETFLVQVLERQIENNEAHIRRFNESIENMEALISMLEDYEYEVDKQPAWWGEA